MSYSVGKDSSYLFVLIKLFLVAMISDIYYRTVFFGLSAQLAKLNIADRRVVPLFTTKNIIMKGL